MYVEFNRGQKFASSYTEISDKHDAFTDAGYLLTENDLVIDVDCLDKDSIKKLIAMFGIKTQIVWTDRGCHFYFKKPEAFRGSTRVCALGFPIEYKHIKNTVAVTIKRDGVLREIDNFGVRETAPDFFIKNKKYENLLGLHEGESRNNKLFLHRSKLSDLPNWRMILRYINNYVFADPLEEKEFQEIVRDLKVSAEKDNEPQIAAYLIQKYKIVKYLGFIYFRKGSDYINDNEKLIRLIYAEVGLQKSKYIDEILKQIDNMAKIIDDDSEFAIKLANGILRDGQFIEIDYEEFTPFTIDIPYFEDADPVTIVDNYIEQLTKGEKEYRNLLLEILGHTLVVNKEFKRLLAKFFIFVGDGGNGKGTLLDIIKKILKPQNVTSLSLKNMKDERYLVTMSGKLANLADDIHNAPIDDDQMKMIKNISTCDFISIRSLYKQSRNTQLSTTLIFTSNHILKSFEKGESYKRRVLWLPMYSKPVKKDPKFITNITTDKALEYWIKLIVEGYMRLYKNRTFTESAAVNQFNVIYHEENNPSMIFLSDFKASDIIGKRPPALYEEFEIWREENGLDGGSKKMLQDAVKEVFGLGIGIRKSQGRTVRVYLSPEETDQELS